MALLEMAASMIIEAMMRVQDCSPTSASSSLAEATAASSRLSAGRLCSFDFASLSRAVASQLGQPGSLTSVSGLLSALC